MHLSFGFDIPSPLFQNGLHVIGQLAGEQHFLFGGRMHKAQFLGVEGMTGQQFETVVDKLAVFRESCAFENLVAAVGGIVEKGMTDKL